MAGNVTRTASRLADGRELLYFDDEPGTDRSQPDRRGSRWNIAHSVMLGPDWLVSLYIFLSAHPR